MSKKVNFTSVSPERVKYLEQNEISSKEVCSPFIRKTKNQIWEIDIPFVKWIEQNQSNPNINRIKLSSNQLWFGVYCKSCGELLIKFVANKPKLDNHSMFIHSVSRFTKKHWFGTFGLNAVNNNGEYKFNVECCCGVKQIKEEKEITVHTNLGKYKESNSKRYVETIIKPL